MGIDYVSFDKSPYDFEIQGIDPSVYQDVCQDHYITFSASKVYHLWKEGSLNESKPGSSPMRFQQPFG